jgi:hypothetical protein
MKEKVRTLGLNMLEYDGCSEIWVKSWDDWMKFYTSEEYAKAMAPDCKYFMAMPITVYAGEENIIFGDAITGMGGTDGIKGKEVAGWEN